MYMYIYIYELPPNTNTRDEKSERELDWIGVKSLCQLNSTQLNSTLMLLQPMRRFDNGAKVHQDGPQEVVGTKLFFQFQSLRR